MIGFIVIYLPFQIGAVVPQQRLIGGMLTATSKNDDVPSKTNLIFADGV
jgi:hypothetical protein